MPQKYSKKEFIKAFWSKVKKTKTCWLWMGARNPVKGEEYGFVAVNRKTRRTHRVAYEMKHGKIPMGKLVLHACDNPPCLRWSHLSTGTSRDNSIDRNNKGRMIYHKGSKHWTHRHPERLARGSRSGRYTHPETTARGELHGMARLTLKAVSRIRRLYLTGRFSYKKLASMFNVATSTIGMMMSGKNWGFASKAENQRVQKIRASRSMARKQIVR